MVNEKDVFFAIAKTVREKQNVRAESNKELGGNQKVSAFIHVEELNAWIQWRKDQNIEEGYSYSDDGVYKQFVAVVYKLQEKGLVKRHKGSWRHKSRVSLDVKGVNYIKSLKGAK